MDRSFPPSASTFIGSRTAARSNLVLSHGGPVSSSDRLSHSRTWSDDLFPATDAERRTHLRMSLRRTLATLAVAGAALGGTIGLIAACTSL